MVCFHADTHCDLTWLPARSTTTTGGACRADREECRSASHRQKTQGICAEDAKGVPAKMANPEKSGVQHTCTSSKPGRRLRHDRSDDGCGIRAIAEGNTKHIRSQ
jgi:hypothetical protein